MIVYNVTLVVHEDLETEFLSWLKDIHLQEVLDTGMFLEGRLFKVIEDPDLKGYNSVAVQYRLESWDHYYTYRDQHAEKLQQKTKDLFGDKVLSFRTFLEEF